VVDHFFDVGLVGVGVETGIDEKIGEGDGGKQYKRADNSKGGNLGE
jgi:hypothetical protein